MATIPCWPYGHDTRNGDCDEQLPDDDHRTIERFGWGWVWDRDDGSGSGWGPFLACPEHRSDCDDEEREVARCRNAAAKTALQNALTQEPKP